MLITEQPVEKIIKPETEIVIRLSKQEARRLLELCGKLGQSTIECQVGLSTPHTLLTRNIFERLMFLDI